MHLNRDFKSAAGTIGKILGIGLLLFSCVRLVTAEDRRDNQYIIGPGDELSIRVLDVSDIPDKPIKVDPDGQISLPLVGRIQAADKSVEAFEADLTERLRTYIISPQVSVSVTEYGSQPVSVLGEVGSPGVYQLSGTKPLAQVIALAKGFAPDAGGRIRIASRWHDNAPPDSRVRFSFAEPGKPLDTSITEVSVEDLLGGSGRAGATPIHPYDVITVPRAQIVYVLGEVHKPGGHVLVNRESVTVLEAISMAEGVLPSGKPQKARLLRHDPNSPQPTEVAIDVRSILAGHGDNVVLHPDDILLIPKDTVRAVALRSVEAAIQLGTGIIIWRRP